jgi:hypothetical protein
VQGRAAVADARNEADVWTLDDSGADAAVAAAEEMVAAQLGCGLLEASSLLEHCNEYTMLTAAGTVQKDADAALPQNLRAAVSLPLPEVETDFQLHQHDSTPQHHLTSLSSSAQSSRARHGGGGCSRSILAVLPPVMEEWAAPDFPEPQRDISGNGFMVGAALEWCCEPSHALLLSISVSCRCSAFLQLLIPTSSTKTDNRNKCSSSDRKCTISNRKCSSSSNIFN